jgi:hypothetical protein
MTLIKCFLFPLLVLGLLASTTALSGCDDDNLIPSTADLATTDDASPSEDASTD